tara:strand:+ start:810 stop:1085 length:276 start_codon:yes stop_codon:yes gene_type:complete
MRTATIFIAACALSISPAWAKQQRSTQARHAFVKAHACPATGLHKLPCKGYVIDHVKALACGGADSPANMQWQTVAEAKAKDRWELKECGK